MANRKDGYVMILIRQEEYSTPYNGSYVSVGNEIYALVERPSMNKEYWMARAEYCHHRDEHMEPGEIFDGVFLDD